MNFKNTIRHEYFETFITVSYFTRAMIEQFRRTLDSQLLPVIKTTNSAQLELVIKTAMSLLRYFKRKNGLPVPKGSLSSTLCSAAIAQANKVEKAIGSLKRRNMALMSRKYTAFFVDRLILVSTCPLRTLCVNF